MSEQAMTDFDKKQLLYKKSMEALNLYNPARRETKRSFTFKKEDLTGYMQNPNSNEINIRNLSRYLYTRSQIYRKIIYDNASMIDTRYHLTIPNIDLGKKRKKIDNASLKSYYETIETVEKMNLPSEMLKAYIECWTCDVFYGAYYYYKDQGGIMIPLDPDYCQIIGLYPTGDFAFAFDLAYFSNRQEELELYGEPFVSMYRSYQNDMTNMKWQQLPDQYACCFKVNLSDYKTILPPYINLFYSLIDLEDLKELNAIEAENQLYKLLYMKVPLFSNSNVPDDFSVNPETAVQYYRKIMEALPDNVASFLTPIDIESISFDPDQTANVNKVENASKNILKTAGHVALADPSGATAMAAALKADESYAISSLLPQTQAWVNRMLGNILSKPAFVRFLPVTKYSKMEYKESLIRDMNFGLPMAQVLNVLNGFSESDAIKMSMINSEIGISDLFVPLATASTQSGVDQEGGRPKEEITSDDAEKSAAKRERAG